MMKKALSVCFFTVLLLCACSVGNPNYQPDADNDADTGSDAADAAQSDLPTSDLAWDAQDLRMADLNMPDIATCKAGGCPGEVCAVGRCRAAVSCRELLLDDPTRSSGIYKINLVNGTPTQVYCDMKTDGGGWTALTNPADGQLPLALPGVGATVQLLAGTTSCAPTMAPFLADDLWRGYHTYACGDAVLSAAVTWKNVLNASDVAFRATVQGVSQHTVDANTTRVAPGASTVDSAKAPCWFWNGAAVGALPLQNQCHSTAPTAPPVVTRGALSGGQDLQLVFRVGPSCSPNCLYGTGLNIVQLMVR